MGLQATPATPTTPNSESKKKTLKFGGRTNYVGGGWLGVAGVASNR